MGTTVDWKTDVKINNPPCEDCKKDYPLAVGCDCPLILHPQGCWCGGKGICLQNLGICRNCGQWACRCQ